MPDPIMLPPLQCRNFNELTEPRMGVMLHYDDSSTDAGALAWFTDPACHVSYNYLVLDDGSYVRVIPEGKRAWHAGVCRTTDPARLPYHDANSAFVGVAVATNGNTPATPAQVDTVVWLAGDVFRQQGWPLSESWRIVGHDTQAIYANKADVPPELRGKRGRKIDPTGSDPSRPVLAVAGVRARLEAGQQVVAPMPG